MYGGKVSLKRLHEVFGSDVDFAIDGWFDLRKTIDFSRSLGLPEDEIRARCLSCVSESRSTFLSDGTSESAAVDMLVVMILDDLIPGWDSSRPEPNHSRSGELTLTELADRFGHDNARDLALGWSWLNKAIRIQRAIGKPEAEIAASLRDFHAEWASEHPLSEAVASGGTMVLTDLHPGVFAREPADA